MRPSMVAGDTPIPAHGTARDLAFGDATPQIVLGRIGVTGFRVVREFSAIRTYGAVSAPEAYPDQHIRCEWKISDRT